LSFLVPVFTGSDDFDELKEDQTAVVSPASSIGALSLRAMMESARGEPIVVTGQKWPGLLPAFPRAGLTGSSISSNRNRAAAGKIVN
jgi:hypothetical protein